MINLNRIPHIYHSTIYARKLFEIIYEKYSKFEKIYNEIETFNNIDAAHGVILDVLGGNFAIFRNGQKDDEYRKKIKLGMISINFMGSVEEIKRILSNYYATETTDKFVITEESGKVIITNPNLLTVNVLQDISVIKSAGIKVQGINVLPEVKTNIIFNNLLRYRIKNRIKEMKSEKILIDNNYCGNTIIYKIKKEV